ncbi:hypothetical protein [Piscirickettsia salmonis]|uniref:hypothetical protein n=1 Tax=Piscirickettsia salmonis TaxID=1238 RepID=UPI000303BEC5|nr:hypothetical protein [Piscirickettsia salmonis]WGZ71293.1 hypothetical protein E3220_06365 [Piscirickettsia salmonis EM-90]APS58449.1 hypothetical protein AVI52_15185 [Piscirickettsia salmonis]QGN76796.1 hypothetical protein Psal001_00987 [Piscirickettsia salmonis]QGN80386.1 hypothetical protein Psal002_01012 [Piscirickettsia salmonis]QGN85342.1 hypothetical protein Psal003_02420 [Piscirickettsia salmonis]
MLSTPWLAAEAEPLFSEFNEFFHKKTEYKIDTARILGFSKERNFLSEKLYDTLLLDAINFTSSSKLMDFFSSAYQEVNPTELNDEGQAFKALNKKLTDATTGFLEKIDISYHPELFKQLIEFGLGNQPSYILDILDCPQFKSLNNQLRYIKDHAPTPTQASNSNPQPGTFLSRFWSKPSDFNTCFNQYQTSVMQSAFSFLFSKERDIVALEKQLTQHKEKFLSRSGLKNSYPDFQSHHLKLFNQLRSQANQPEPVATYTLLHSQHETTVSANIPSQEM